MSRDRPFLFSSRLAILVQRHHFLSFNTIGDVPVTFRMRAPLRDHPIRKIFPFVLPVLLVAMISCDIGEDNEDPATKSQRLRTEAAQASAQHADFRAEQLFSRLLPLDCELQQWDRLAEDQAAAARVQGSLGLFSSGLENYTSALNHYRQVGDHTMEVRLLNGIGSIRIGLGDFEKGIGILNEALSLSKLNSNSEPDPETCMNLGNAYMLTAQYEKGLDQFAAALAIFTKRKYPPAVVRAMCRIGAAYARLGRQEEALGTYSTVEHMVSGVPNVLVKAGFSLDLGRSYESLGDWSAAAQSFQNGIAILENLSGSERNEQTNDVLILLYTALGKVYMHNFAFPIAKQSFIEAYTRAKDAGRKIAIGYLLIAIADCERKIGAVNPVQEASIAASTLYEQAITLFSRIGNISGESYANYRLGAMKEDEGNTDAALSFFRRSFELCSSQTGEYRNWSDDVEFFELRANTGSSASLGPDTYWYEPLVVALAREGRAEEALWIYEQGKMKSLSAQLRSFHLDFREKSVGQSVNSIEDQIETEGILEAETVFQRGLNADQRDAQRIEETARKAAAMKKELRDAAGTLSQKYPQLEVLFRTPGLQEADLRTAMAYGTVVLDYLLNDDRILIFVISFDGMGRQFPVNVVEVPVYKDIVLEKVRQFDLMLREHIHRIGTGYTQTTDIERVSQDLYTYFLRPVERLFAQRVIIVPPVEMDQIPFHAFTRSTSEGVKPLIEIADVSYLPYLAAIKSLQVPSRFVNTVVAVGNPRGNNWPLDFELRDIRSFFRNATVSVSQNANTRQLFGAEGDVLQLSTDFTTDTLFPGQSSFVLSSGSITDPNAHVPVGAFMLLHPFPIVYLSDQQASGSELSPLHAAVLMMNGTSSVILSLKPTEPKASKFFSERFYSVLAKGDGVNEAYRSAVATMSASRNFSAPYQWAQFFKFGK